MNVRDRIARLLEVSAAATVLKTKADVLRAELHAEALRRLEADGAAPAWSTRGLGKVRLDGVDAPRRARVDDADAFASWVAEHGPDGMATAVVELDPAVLERALEALRFAGVDVKRSRVDVDPSFTAALLDDLELEVERVLADDQPAAVERVTALRVNPTTGETTRVPGIGAHPPAPPRLVVQLDPERKRLAVAVAEDELAAEDRDATAAAELAGIPVTTDPTVERDVVEVRDASTEEPLAHIKIAEDGTAVALHPLATRVVDHANATGHRDPYVGDGVDGARRSAQIDREEVDTLPLPGQDGYDDRAEERRTYLLASADRWDRQAAELEAAELEPDAYPVDPAPELSPEEAATVARFEDADDAVVEDEVERRYAEAVADPDNGDVAIVGDVEDAAAIREALADDQDVRRDVSPAARDAARRTLAAIVATEAVAASSKVDDLRRLVELAELGLPRAKVAKPVLVDRIREALAQLEASA